MDRIEQFVRLFGKGTQGKLIMETYMGYKRHMEAWKTPIGAELMGDLVSQLTALAGKLEKGDANERAHIEYEVLKRHADSVADKISHFYRMHSQIQEKIKKG